MLFVKFLMFQNYVILKESFYLLFLLDQDIKDFKVNSKQTTEMRRKWPWKDSKTTKENQKRP